MRILPSCCGNIPAGRAHMDASVSHAYQESVPSKQTIRWRDVRIIHDHQISLVKTTVFPPSFFFFFFIFSVAPWSIYVTTTTGQHGLWTYLFSDIWGTKALFVVVFFFLLLYYYVLLYYNTVADRGWNNARVALARGYGMMLMLACFPYRYSRSSILQDWCVSFQHTRDGWWMKECYEYLPTPQECYIISSSRSELLGSK